MYQQYFMQRPMPMVMNQGHMGGGIGGLGGQLNQAFDPLKAMLGNYLTDGVIQEKVEPFVEEVKQMAQERFGLQDNMSGSTPSYAGYGSGGRGEVFNAEGMSGSVGPVPDGLKNIGDVNFRAAFGQGMKDGGEVMQSPMSAGLGSFLTSNIDEFGRNGDTEMIHATREEVIMPKGMMEDPQIRETVRQAFERTGRDMAEFTVGSGQMNVNPFTGYEEAFDIIKGIKKIFKKAAPILLPAAVSFLFPGMAPVVSGAIAGGVGSLLQGGDLKDALKGAALGGVSSSLMRGITSGGKDFGFKGDPSLAGKFGIRKFGEGAGTTLEGKLSSVKDFFVEPKQTIGQLAEDAKIDLATASEATKLDLLAKANQSGGLNYAKAIPAGLGAMALVGAFDPIEADPVSDPYEYTTRELLDMYPERYRSGPFIRPIRVGLDDVMDRRDDEIVAFAAKGGEMNFPRRQGFISGPGTETSDDVPAMLSDGEFVMTARAVRGAGNGSRKEGVKKMYDMMRAFEGGAVA